MKIERLKVYDFENAIRAMREPMNSMDKSDSYNSNQGFVIGKNDLNLMKKLYKGGSPHSKFMRQIPVSFELVDAPVYWLAEFDTYKVGVVRNSSSFMHKGLSEKFSLDDFEVDFAQMPEPERGALIELIATLNIMRADYLSTKDPDIFLRIRKLLPMSYRYNSMISTNLAAIANMIEWRENHRLPEWRYFCDFMLGNIPYLSEIMGKKDV